MFGMSKEPSHEVIHEYPRHIREKMRRQRWMVAAGVALVTLSVVSLFAMGSFFG